MCTITQAYSSLIIKSMTQTCTCTQVTLQMAAYKKDTQSSSFFLLWINESYHTED